MDVKKYLFRSSSIQGTQSIRLGRSYTKPRSHWSYGGARNMWDMLRRKLRKEKIAAYNSETYSLNFDQGLGSMEPENLCRSFSARYADPSRILPPEHLLDSWTHTQMWYVSMLCMSCFFQVFYQSHAIWSIVGLIVVLSNPRI